MHLGINSYPPKKNFFTKSLILYLYNLIEKFYLNIFNDKLLNNTLGSCF